MSRSYRKTPRTGWCCCRSDKPYKRIYHRRYRSAVRTALRSGRAIPHYREYSDPWWWGKDGKQYFGHMLGDHRERWDGFTYHDIAVDLMRK